MNGIIIGGGAAGLMAGCLLSRAGIAATILEKQPRVGRKLLSTGNGRCNLTNLNASPRDYHGDARYVRAALRALPPGETVALFESLGILCEADSEGRVYPAANLAAGVLDGLRLYARENGCDIRTDCAAAAIRERNGGWTVECGETLTADFVIVTCGGVAAPKLGACADGYRLLESAGHTVSPRVPGIAALKTDANAVRALKGIRMRGTISLMNGDAVIRAERGEILFGDGLISGIAAMQLARDVNLRPKDRLTARLCFGENVDLSARAALLPDRPMEDFLSGVVPKRLGQTLVKAAGVGQSDLAGDLHRREIEALQRALTGWTLPILGTQGFDQAQVTVGGARLSEFDPDTLESRRHRNLFAAGEVLDVDGDCGGFNLQWAWASAKLVCDAIRSRI